MSVADNNNNPKWDVVGEIGRGGFGKVYKLEASADSTAKNQVSECAMKYTQGKKYLKGLHTEARVYAALSKRAPTYYDLHIPKYFYKCNVPQTVSDAVQDGTDTDSTIGDVIYGGDCDDVAMSKVNAFLMELMGPTLETLRVSLPGSKCSLKTALYVMLQLIDRVEFLHKNGYVHGDIKPGNVAISLTQRNRLKLLDLGFSTIWTGDKEDLEAKLDYFKGSYSYASLNMLRKYTQAPRDDVESILYTVLNLNAGRLPWGRICAKTAKEKREYTKLRLSYDFTALEQDGYDPNLASLIRRMLSYLWALSRRSLPDYGLLRQMVYQTFQTANLVDDQKYDWSASAGSMTSSQSKKSSSKRKAPDHPTLDKFLTQAPSSKRQKIM